MSTDDKAPTPLRICCYGSSSSQTPARYTNAAYDLGMILAKRGHTCVNGAGTAGCMAAMNQGAHDHNGRIVGVIHEMFVVDGSDWLEGSHSVFTNGEKNELLIAKGDNLQERKRLLVDGADALIVLPGGPGTWDELWEMACARHIGLHHLPIVCVNTDGYYDPFMTILQRAHSEGLLYKHPTEIVHFEESSEAAVRWVENFLADPENIKKRREVKRRSSMLKRMESNLSGNAVSAWGRMTSFFGDANVTNSKEKDSSMLIFNNILVFAAGLSVGLLLVATRRSK